jgi:hypothetical protein
MGTRFDIVVFNFERIASLVNNFDKIKNFRPDRDRLLILDCSVNYESEEKLVEEFVQRYRLRVGKEVLFIRRKNWGIDQGARVDYLSDMRNANDRPSYIWQFQEHYLDLTSDWSIWPKDTPNLGGQIKNDTIPDNLALDLDECERIYDNDENVSVIYADRGKLGIFTHDDGSQWFYAGGANFSVRTADALEVFRPNILDSYRAIYDGTYQWALFMELDYGRRLTRTGREWYDLKTHYRADSPSSLRQVEAEKQVSLHQSAEAFYNPLYSKYEKRFDDVLREHHLWRKLHALLSLWFVDLLASKSTLRVKRVIASMGLTLVAKRMRHYVSGVLRQQ